MVSVLFFGPQIFVKGVIIKEIMDKKLYKSRKLFRKGEKAP